MGSSFDSLIAEFEKIYVPGGPVDLTDGAQLAAAEQLGADLVAAGSAADLDALEGNLTEDASQHALLTHVAAKIARSRSLVLAATEPAKLSVCFAVYKEHNRIRRASEHPNGEDFLRRKVAQLDWLCAGSQATWELLVVDDGCPEGSGRIAESIIAEEGWGDRVRVLFIEEAIAEKHPAIGSLTSANDSRKGGSVHLGMWEGAEGGAARHAVIFTDADLSTHLGQCGNLLAPILDGQLCAAGSRREPRSVVVKGGARNDRGKLFIYLWKRLLPQLGHIVDTQCGFKGFDARIVRDIIDGSIEKRFAFDIELMLRTELRQPGAITRVPVAWFDSEAESTTTDLQPYLAMLQATAAMYRAYLPQAPTPDSFAELLDSLDEDAWQRLVQHIPEAITSREPASFNEFDGVSADDLRP